MTERKIKTKRACVVVLGDIGRSPRMQYHTKSLAENNLIVDLVGYVSLVFINFALKTLTWIYLSG